MRQVPSQVNDGFLESSTVILYAAALISTASLVFGSSKIPKYNSLGFSKFATYIL